MNNLPTLPNGYRLAEPGEIIKEGWGSYFDGTNLYPYIYLPYGWLLLNSNSMAVGLQVGESERYICPISPPPLPIHGYTQIKVGETIKPGAIVHYPEGIVPVLSGSINKRLGNPEYAFYNSISPPSLHLPFSEADPLPEGKEGDVLIVLKVYDMPELYYFDPEKNAFTNSGMCLKGFGEAGYKFSRFDGLRYGIFNITT